MLLASACALALAAGCASTPTPITDAAASVQQESTMTDIAASPLLAPWGGPFGGVPPWDQVKPADFPPAFEVAIAELNAEIDAIATNAAPPTFENTIAVMERSGRTMDRVLSMFGVFTSNLADDEVQELDKEWSPKLTAVYDGITFNEALFQRIAAIHAARESANLTPVQKRLLERTYAGFVRQGAQLDAAGKTRLGEMNQQLASLFAEFSARVLADEETWTALEETDLAGLPDGLKSAAKAAGEANGLPGKYLIVNTRSSVDPFLTLSSRRDLREIVWKKFKNRGDNGGESDTNALIADITKLRAERAKLLGYPTHAHWRMDDTMAKDPQKAEALMQTVWPAAVARVKEEVADMQAVAKKEGANITIEPWDYLYYAEKVRKAKYDLDQNEIKPYFELNNMVEAAFWSAGQLYGLQFKENTGAIPVFHPDVRTWEVTDKAGNHVGVFYGDNFARTGKRSGAWMTTYRSHETFDGKRTPLASNNNNFVKGPPGEPVLISIDDAETLFHEFGHAIHYLLSNVEYPGLGNTPRDYVEYPSQVNEHWLLTRPVLDRFAKHYQTGEPMPQALVDKIAASSKFNQGYATVEYLSSAIVDMRMHNRPDGVADPDAFERTTMTEIGAPTEVVMRHRLPQFLHLFSSDAYSAGYYSYLWSEVMDADTWKAFEESGDVFDPTLAQKMKDYILAPGNATDRAEAFRQFRGRDPDVKALLEVRGFPTE
jgi:peptidyl-dipeptidase Dcp